MMDHLLGGLTTVAVIKWFFLVFASGCVSQLAKKLVDFII